MDPGHALTFVLIHGRIAQHVDQERIVDLEDEPGVDDGQVLLPHRLGYGREVLLVAGVVLVAPEAARPGGWDERLGHVERLDGCPEVVDVGLQQLLADVADRATTDDAAKRGDGRRVLLEVLRVVLGEVVDLLLPRRRHPRRLHVGLEAAEAVLDVAEEADLAHLPVGHDVDAVLDLLAHPVGHGVPHLTVEELGVVRPTVLPLLHRVEQLGRPGQAAGMRRQDAFGAALHRVLPGRGVVTSS